MNNNEQLPIRGLSIDWDKIEPRSYLRGIESIAGLHQLEFHKPGWGYFLRAVSFYTVATAEDEYSREPGGRPQHFHEKSHGESFLVMAQSNFKSNGIYLLDEPEAALSPQRQLTLLLEIVGCARAESQFIIATHSPILLSIPDSEIFSFDDGQIHTCSYEETGSYQVTEMFINNREQILHRLLDVE